jgi:hypothetical protein
VWVLGAEADALLFGCGTDPSMLQQIKQSVSKSVDNPALACFSWSMPTPVMQRSAQNMPYTEYFVLAKGHKCTIKNLPAWFDSLPAYLPGSHRFSCGVDVLKSLTPCPTTTWARTTCCKHLRQPDKTDSASFAAVGVSTTQVHYAGDEDCDSTDDGGNGVARACVKPPLASSASRRHTSYIWRLGMHMDTWDCILEALLPPAVVLVNPLHTQQGLLLSVLRHNDKMRGGVHCLLVAFHPYGSVKPLTMTNANARNKLLQAAHNADHALAVVAKLYIEFYEG